MHTVLLALSCVRTYLVPVHGMICTLLSTNRACLGGRFIFVSTPRTSTYKSCVPGACLLFFSDEEV